MFGPARRDRLRASLGGAARLVGERYMYNGKRMRKRRAAVTLAGVCALGASLRLSVGLARLARRYPLATKRLGRALYSAAAYHWPFSARATPARNGH